MGDRPGPVEFGVMMYTTDRSLRPGELARELEQRGYFGYFVPDHTHVPTSRATPYPAGGDIPADYARLLEPFAALTDAAAATTTLRLGTCVCLVAQRDLVILAKQIATVDHLSNGRFIFGVGYGWNVEEMANHGLDHRRRHAVLREKVLAMQRLWTLDEAHFEGEHVTLQASWMWPKPVQQPHPPIWLGGSGPTAFRHTAEFADVWFPVAGGVSQRRPMLDEALRAADRDPATVPTAVIAPLPSVEAFRHYQDCGVDRVVLHLPSEPDRAMQTLDRFDAVIDRFRREVEG